MSSLPQTPLPGVNPPTPITRMNMNMTCQAISMTMLSAKHSFKHSLFISKKRCRSLPTFRIHIPS
uniref:Uncharacterized protein n=1 Tax=Picea glauca TaxID=3330 RepID=A0A101M1B0_PICGL|nr:hypothetical protein ABT39_MTgene4419 [Picea glauca]